MKVFIQVINTKTAVYQTGMIEESVIPGLEVQNALKHFGVIFGEVTWLTTGISHLLYGFIKDTNKIVSVITI